ncbi:MAG TPA: archaellin/type IV pilin N-terminal domain-containing protein [Candidatus Thermoplasmatota archaeon]|nr:archaellin/type IV pilin N-terminal domain-containing protein [Candidatus Thermoplasmatota archaeon]
MPSMHRSPLRPDESAETGIGTMIVFIAAVLVAAIAAGVLISTSGNLQEKSSRTGEEATQQVASNLLVQNALGRRDDASSARLQDMELFISLAPGADDMDLSEMRIQVTNATQIVTLAYAGSPGATHFAASAVRDADGSFSATTPVMSAGDLIKVDLDLDAAGLAFGPREHVRIVLLPEVGASVSASLRMPNSYGTHTVVELL